MSERNEKVLQLNTMSKNYHLADADPDGMTKVFNNGMGRLDFVKVLEEEKIVLVNDLIADKKDYAKIKQVFPDYKIEKAELGYPDYYFHGLKWAWRHKNKAV